GGQAVIIDLELGFGLSPAVVTFLRGLGIGSCTRWSETASERLDPIRAAAVPGVIPPAMVREKENGVSAPPARHRHFLASRLGPGNGGDRRRSRPGSPRRKAAKVLTPARSTWVVGSGPAGLLRFVLFF